MKIVMADDDADDRYLSLFAFKRLKTTHTLEFVTDGQELINYLTSREDSKSELPDLILLDLNMPKRNGKETLLEIKSNPKLKHLPVIIFSTSNLPKDMDDTFGLGAENYVVKPSNLNKLMEAFHKILNGPMEK